MSTKSKATEVAEVKKEEVTKAAEAEEATTKATEVAEEPKKEEPRVIGSLK